MADFEDKIPFQIMRGLEEKILNKPKDNGCLYFATDTGKIYLDTLEENKILMGGGANSGIFYAKKKFTDPADTTFTLKDITGDDLPNVNDLIINISADIGGDEERDGFYQVVEVIQEEEKVITNYLPVGSGGSGGGGGTKGFAAIEYIIPKDGVAATLVDEDYYIEYNLIAQDSNGDTVKNPGTATWIINGKSIDGGQVYPGNNRFNIKDYLDGTRDINTIKLSISIFTGSSVNTIVSKIWQITAIDLKLTWNYTFPMQVIANSSFTLQFMPSGNIESKVHLLIDDNISYEKTISASQSQNWNSIDVPNGLAHGVHTAKMWLTATINNIEYRTTDIIHEIIAQDTNNNLTLITTSFDLTEATQWDTISIPYALYFSTSSSVAPIYIYINNEKVMEKLDCESGKEYIFEYALGISGEITIRLDSDSAESRELKLNVKPLNLEGVTEPQTPTFKLKASEINSNDDLKNMSNLIFSEGFDWDNGGLQSEKDENGNVMKYICIKNGDTLTIDYNLFGSSALRYGRNFKIIFKATNCYDYDAQVLDCYDENGNKVGLKINAQNAFFSSGSTSVNTMYCEDSYIEFETEVWNKPSDGVEQYITLWVDGIPNATRIYDDSDNFIQTNVKKITIGSNNCDVYIYLVKIYERYLNNEEHLNNFILDAPNAQEMLARYNRNNILDNRGEISYEKLIENNPNCHAYLYEISKMTEGKKDKVPCSYQEYVIDSNKKKHSLRCDSAELYVQGTSSAAYGVAAYNVRTDFKGDLINENNEVVEGRKVSSDSIPIRLTCTKANVASCEGVNNALNQEWYNKFQPYYDAHRRAIRQDGNVYRDCMEFDFGVMFIKDNNTNSDYSSEANYLKANLFADTQNYLQSPYYKQYTIGNMGTDKKNIEIFHKLYNNDGTTDLNVCCVENTDNQTKKQFMTEEINEDDFALKSPPYEFRYPDGNDAATKEQKKAWMRVVNWMAKNNPNAATNEPLEQTVTFEPYEFKGFIPPGYTTPSPTGISLAGYKERQYAGTYDTDTKEYRMAKMLNECEDYLVMDSIVYHYLFIQRHTMVDNVAKNTFWSTEDLKHWDLTRNYDNDTADGNNNTGNLVFGYGLEILDKDSNTKSDIFNASQSVWLNFIYNLPGVQANLYQKLANYIIDDTNVWDSKGYLKLFKETQSLIPERCWIYDYNRKYFRPNKLFNNKTFLSRLDGGKKTHQRKQYETYQDIYLASKYKAGDFNDSKTSGVTLDIRLNYDDSIGKWDKSFVLPMKFYIDLYPSVLVGGNTWRSESRISRNEIVNIPIGELVDTPNDATCYLYGRELIQQLNNLSYVYPQYVTLTGAKKLREVEIGSSAEGYYNPKLEQANISTNIMLERASIQNSGLRTGNGLGALNISNLKSLKYLNISGSTYTALTLADSGLLEECHLNGLQTLSMSNLKHLKTIKFDNTIYNSLINLYVKNCNTIDTYDLVKNSNNLQKYCLLGINWIITDQTLTSDNKLKNIDILDKLIALGVGGVQEGYTQQTALSGTITINLSNAYTVDEYEIYKKYHKIYPNIELKYSGEVTKKAANKITFYKDDSEKNEVLYSVLTDPNNTTETIGFLTSEEGPSGVAIGIPEKPKDNRYEYYWNLSNNEGFAEGEIFSVQDWEDINTGIKYTKEDLDNLIPTTNMIFKPIFSVKYRRYNVVVKDYDGSVKLSYEGAQGIPYGTKLTNIPYYMFRPNDKTNRRWEFQGWISVKDYLSGTNNPTYITDFTITSDLTVYAHYTEQDYTKTASRLEYFNFVPWQDTSKGKLNGYKISLKKEYKSLIQEPITLPLKYNNRPIYVIDGFGFNSNSDSNVSDGTTQILCPAIYFEEGESQYFRIGNYAFALGVSNQKYVDSQTTIISLPATITEIGAGAFEQHEILNNLGNYQSIETIESGAFRHTNINLNLNTMTNLKNVGIGAFQIANGIELIDANFPEHLKTITNFAFSNCPKVNISDFRRFDSIGISAFSNSGKNTTEIIIDTKTDYNKAENAFSNYGKDPSTLNITIYTTSGTVFDEKYLGLAGVINKIEQ